MTYLQLILCYWSLSAPPENRKYWFSDIVRGCIEKSKCHELNQRVCHYAATVFHSRDLPTTTRAKLAIGSLEQRGVEYVQS